MKKYFVNEFFAGYKSNGDARFLWEVLELNEKYPRPKRVQIIQQDEVPINHDELYKRGYSEDITYINPFRYEIPVREYKEMIQWQKRKWERGE